MSSTTAKLKVYLVLCTVRHLDPTPMENPALHGLKAYLESLPDINDRFDIEVYEYAPVASVPVLDSEWHYSRVVSTLLAEQPDILCFSLYAWNITQCCELASWVKQVSPEIAMVAGGPEVFEREAFTGQFPVFDLVVEGDGELPLQEILVQHENIVEVAVFGVPDEKWGETPVAAVILADKNASTPEELREWLSERVEARYQQVREVIVWDEFPRSVAGKTLKRIMRDAFWQDKETKI